MRTGLQDDDVVIRDEVDQAIRIVDAAGPRAGEDVPEGSGLPMPANGSRSASVISWLMRLRVLRSWVWQ